MESWGSQGQLDPINVNINTNPINISMWEHYGGKTPIYLTEPFTQITQETKVKDLPLGYECHVMTCPLVTAGPLDTRSLGLHSQLIYSTGLLPTLGIQCLVGQPSCKENKSATEIIQTAS